MADLIACPSCGNQVYSGAASCPKCGRPISTPTGHFVFRIIGLLFGVLAVLCVIVGFANWAEDAGLLVWSGAFVVISLLFFRIAGKR